MDGEIKPTAKTTLEKFKHQNMMAKRFGKDGVYLYKAIKDGISVEKLKERTDIPDDVFNEMVKYMLENKIVTMEGGTPEENIQEVHEEKPPEETNEPEIP